MLADLKLEVGVAEDLFLSDGDAEVFDDDLSSLSDRGVLEFQDRHLLP